MQSLGDLNFAIRSILSAVLVALVFSTATIMMQTVRERTPELAVLKTLGFGNRTVFLLIAAESLLVCIAASLAGLALAWIAFPLAAKYIPGLSMPMEVGPGILGPCSWPHQRERAGPARVRLNIVDALADGRGTHSSSSDGNAPARTARRAAAPGSCVPPSSVGVRCRSADIPAGHERWRSAGSDGMYA
jgi:hypothetical protein